MRREIKTRGIKSSVIDGLKRKRGRERERKRETCGPCVESIEILSNEGVFSLCAKNINKVGEKGGKGEEGTRSRKEVGNINIIISMYI